MNYEQLIKRHFLEDLALHLGHKDVLKLSLTDLESIAAEHDRTQKELHRVYMEKNHLPHSYVLAESFDTLSHYAEVPDHVLEEEPNLDWVTCPACNGEKRVETDSFYYAKVNEYFLVEPDYAPCMRCHAEGVILDTVNLEDTCASVQPSLANLKEAA